MPKGVRPPNAGIGRKKGVPNKTTIGFKTALLEAFHRLGGTEGMTTWGEKNPTEFYKIAARLIPHEVIGPGADGQHLIQTIVDEHVTDDPAEKA